MPGVTARECAFAGLRRLGTQRVCILPDLRFFIHLVTWNAWIEIWSRQSQTLHLMNLTINSPFLVLNTNSGN